MKKGFVLTMDAFLALMTAALFTATIIYFTASPRVKTGEYLYLLGGDFLAVADRDGSILSAVGGETDQLNEFVEAMPDNICLSLKVSNSSGAVVLSHDGGCQPTNDYVMAKRMIVNGTHNYIAAVRVWYR